MPFDFVHGLRFRAELLLLPGDLALEGANLRCDRADRIDQSPPRIVAQPEPRDLRGDLHSRARDTAFEAHRFLRSLTIRKRGLVPQFPPVPEPAAEARANSPDPFERQS